MSAAVQFRITNHATERLFERGGKLLRHVPKTATPYARKIEAERMIARSKEVKSFINDTRFMSFLHRKYGYDRVYKAYTVDGLVFLGIVHPDAIVIVTVMDQQEHRVNHFRHG